jgi:uncharacterized protein YkwD
MPPIPHVRKGLIVTTVVGALAIGGYAAHTVTEGQSALRTSSSSRVARESRACALAAPGWTGTITGIVVTGHHTVTEKGIVVSLNRIRAQHHLPRLSTSVALRDAARYHSSDMLRRGYFAHDRAGESFTKRFSRYVRNSCFGENIAWGTGHYGTAAGIVTGWMNSPPHRHIIMLPWIRKVGVGVIVGKFQGERDASIVTADFST